MVNPGSFPRSRGEFLDAQTKLYAEAVKDNHVADTLADIQRRFFQRYPVTMADTEEPSQEWLANIDDDAPGEELRYPEIEGMDKEAADKALAEYSSLVTRTKFKKDQIKRRLHYIYSKNKDTESDFDKAVKDPISNITSKLLGIELKLPRRKTAYNVWGPKHRAEVDPVFSERVEELGANKEQHAAIRSAVYKELFEALPADAQKKWSTIAEREHEQNVIDVKKRFKNSLSSSPEDRQRVIAALPKFIEPILDAIGEYTGWKASFIAGGPEPADGGRLNMISIHSGTTAGPVKMDFGRAQKSTYKNHIAPAFGTFLKKCYTVHDCRGSALPQNHSSISISDVAGDEEVAMQVHTFESDAEHESMHKPKRLFEEIAKSGKSTKGSRPLTGTPSPRLRFGPPIGKTKNRTLPIKDSSLVKLGPSPLSQSFVAGIDATSSSNSPAASSSSSAVASSVANQPLATTSASSNQPVTADDVVESPKTHRGGKNSKAGGAAQDPEILSGPESGQTHGKVKEANVAAPGPATSSTTTDGATKEINAAAPDPVTSSTTTNGFSAAATSSTTTDGVTKEINAAAPDPVTSSTTTNRFSAAATSSTTTNGATREVDDTAPDAVTSSTTTNTVSKRACTSAAIDPATALTVATGASEGPPRPTPSNLSAAAAASKFAGLSSTTTGFSAAATSSTLTNGATREVNAAAPDTATSSTTTNAVSKRASTATTSDPATAFAVTAGASEDQTDGISASSSAAAASSKLAALSSVAAGSSPADLTSTTVAAAAVATTYVTNTTLPISAEASGTGKEHSASEVDSSASAMQNPAPTPFTPAAVAGASKMSRTNARKAPPASSPPPRPESPPPSPPASLPPSPQASPLRPTTPVKFGGAATVPDPSEIEATPGKGRKRKGVHADKENKEHRASKRVKVAPAAPTRKRKASEESDAANKRQRTGGSASFTAAVPEGCAPWVLKALRLLTTHDLGPQWRSLVDAWLVFEQGFSFAKERKPFLPSLGRPAIIGEWIKRAREPTWIPGVGSLDEYESAFNSWWHSVQSDWQAYSGNNGVLSLLAGLFFWGHDAFNTPSSAAWEAAVTSVSSALQDLGAGK